MKIIQKKSSYEFLKSAAINSAIENKIYELCSSKDDTDNSDHFFSWTQEKPNNVNVENKLTEYFNRNTTINLTILNDKLIK